MKNASKSAKAKARRLAAAKMLKDKAKTFKGKVEYVKEHIPSVTDPEAFVAGVLREAGEIP